MQTAPATLQEGSAIPRKPAAYDHPMTELSKAELSTKVLRRIALAGWCLSAAYITVLVTWGVLDPDPYSQGWRLVLELAFLGRVVSLADGIASGFSQTYLLIQTGFQDIITLLIFYPLAVAAYQGSSKKGLLSGSINRMRRTAEKHRHIVEPVGVIGLWLFVLFPFWSTGVLVGSVVGYLIGLRTTTVFASVFSSHVISVVSLIWFFDSMRGVIEAFDQSLVRFLPWMILGILLLLSLTTRLVRRLRTQRP